MYSRSAAFVLAISFSSLAATGCSGGASSGAATGGFALTAGTYDDVITSVPVDTCWAPPKTNPTLPMTIVAAIAVDGNTLTVTPETTGGVSQSFTVTRDGNALTGDSVGDADLNPDLNCVLHIVGTFDGTVTGDDAFDATQTVTISQQSGDCSLLVGTFDPNQLDALPCTFTLQGSATKRP